MGITGFPGTCLNRAVYHMGSALEQELNGVKEGKGAEAKRRLILHRWMRTTEKMTFRDPARSQKG